jgi:hypothetical protein
MKNLNNCNVVGLVGCASCHLPIFVRCWSKVVRELQFDVFKKIKDTPQFKREQERLMKEK